MPGMLPPVLAEIRAEGGNFFAEMGKVRGEMHSTASHGKAAFHGLASVGKAALLGTAAGALAVGGAALKMGMEFQEATVSLQNSAGISNAAAGAIGKAFLDTAGSTTFSAKEMMSSFAGVAGQFTGLYGHALSAADSLKFMTSASDLAEASGTNLTDSTKSLSDIMVAFHEPIAQAAIDTNLMYNTSRLSGVGVSELGSAFSRMHARLGEVMPTLKDSATMLLELRQQGIQGSRGLMVVNGAFNTLLGGAKPVAKEMAALGVHLFDQKGQFVGLQSTITQLSGPMSKMTDQQRMLAEKSLFGAGAAEVMDGVIRKGAAGYAQAAAQIGKAGAAEAAAAAQRATLQGQMKVLAVTVEDLGTKFGLILIPWVEKAGKLALQVAGYFKQHKDQAELLGAAVGGVLLVAVAAYAVAMISAAVATIAATWPILAVIAGVALLGAGLVWAYGHVKVFHDAVNFMGGVLKQVPGFIVGAVGAIIHFGAAVFKAIGGAIHFVITGVPKIPGAIVKAVGDALSAVVKWGADMLAAIGRAIGGAIAWVGQEIPKLPFQIGHALGHALGMAVKFGVDLIKWATTEIPKFIASVIGFIHDLPGKAWDEFWLLEGKLHDLEWDLIRWATTAIPKFIGQVVGFIHDLPGKAWNEFMAFEGKVHDLEVNLYTWATTAIPKFVASVVTELKKLPGMVIGIGEDVVKGIWQGIQNMAGWIKGGIGDFFKGLVGGAKDAIQGHSPSQLFADQIGLPIAQGIAQGISAGAGGAHAALGGLVGGLNGSASVGVNVNAAGSGPATGETAAQSGLTIQVTVQGNVLNWEQTAQQMAEPIRAALLRQKRTTGNLGLA